MNCKEKNETLRFETNNFKDNKIEINNCLFKWLIYNQKGSAIFVEKDSINMIVNFCDFLGCISIHLSYSGAVSVLSSSSSLILSDLSFISCIGGYSSCIHLDSNTDGNIHINRTTSSACYQYYSTIYFEHTDVVSSSYNSSFCISTRLHLFCGSRKIPNSYCSYHIFYKNPTTINWCICSPSSQNYLVSAAFIENTYQADEYGIIHTSGFDQQKTYLNNIIFMGNTHYLFNAYQGSIFITNVFCDEFSQRGTQVITDLTLKTGVSFNFPSPFNQLNNCMKNIQKKRNSNNFHSYLSLFTIFNSHR